MVAFKGPDMYNNTIKGINNIEVTAICSSNVKIKGLTKYKKQIADKNKQIAFH